jgi:hypothetical protein
MPNSGIKGFPLLSGLVALVELMVNHFIRRKSRLEIIYKKNHPFTVSRKIADSKGVSFEKGKN